MVEPCVLIYATSLRIDAGMPRTPYVYEHMYKIHEYLLIVQRLTSKWYWRVIMCRNRHACSLFHSLIFVVFRGTHSRRRQQMHIGIARAWYGHAGPHSWCNSWTMWSHLQCCCYRNDELWAGSIYWTRHGSRRRVARSEYVVLFTRVAIAVVMLNQLAYREIKLHARHGQDTARVGCSFDANPSMGFRTGRVHSITFLASHALCVSFTHRL